MSSEDFKSLILTDPDLIDEGIDVSGLRTQTNTNPRLLGSISDYPGIQYDPTSYSYLSDLNRLFASGLPEIDTSQPTTPAPPSGGDGGGGGGGGTTPTQPDSIGGFDPGVVPGPSGFIGLDPEYDLDPKDYIDDPTYSPFTPTGDSIEMENIMTYENPYDEPMDFDDPAASIENILQPNTPGTIGGPVDVFDINQTGDPSQNPGSTNVGDQPMVAGPFNYLQPISKVANPDIFNNYAGVNDPQVGDPGFTGYTPSFETPEQESTVQNIFGKVGDDVSLALTELGKLPGAFVDTFNKTVDVFGRKIDVGKTLGAMLLNKFVDGPATIAIQFLDAVLPEQDPRIKKLDNFYSTGEGSKYISPTIKDKNGKTITNPNYIPGLDQYNTVSGGLLNMITQGKYGTPTNYGLQGTYQKSIDRIEKTLADKHKMTATEIADVKAGIYKGDVDSDLIRRIQVIAELKKEEADMLGITAAEDKRLKELDYKNYFAGNKDQDTTPTTTFTGVNPFKDIDTGVGEFGGTPITTNITSDQIDEFDIVGEPVYDERLGWIDSITEKPVEDPNLDVVGIGSVEENVMNNFQQQLDSLKAQKEQVGELGLPTDQIDDAIKELEEKIEKLNKELSPIKPVSLNTIDTSDDDPIDSGPVTTGSGNNPFGYTDPTPPSETPQDTGGQGGGADMGTAPKGGTYDAEAEDDQYEAPAPTPTPDYYGDAISRGQTGGGSDSGCFIRGTLITMADKTTKPVEQVDLEDEVAVGGKVFAVGRFLNTELYNYKGIKVSGSHMVNEEGVWMRVRDTKHGKSLGDDKHTVYVFGSENRRILINGILFTDYFEVKDQEQLSKKENKFFDDWKTFANNEDQKNVDTLNAI